MNVGILAERIGTEAGGIETYELGLIKGLMEIDRINSYNIHCSANDILPAFFSDQKQFISNPLFLKSKLLQFSLELPVKLMGSSVDFLHICTFPLMWSPKPYILTIHDLAPFLMPELFPRLHLYRLKFLLSRGIKKAKIIISDSEATKQDLIKIFNINPEKIRVIHLGIDKCYQPQSGNKITSQVLEKYGIKEPYILYLGRIQARKNIVRLIQAFNILKKKLKIRHKLVMAGKGTWKYDDPQKEIAKLGIGNEIIQLNHIPQEYLPFLYSASDLFVFPSLFEGFGFPPLEAMACGVPVASSYATSLAEIVGDAALTFNPYDVEEIAEKMSQLLTDEDLRKEKIKKGLARAALFTWENTAKKTHDVYKEVYDML